ncbi:hypothetical protein PG990_007827 [Apiospora arundinis]
MFSAPRFPVLFPTREWLYGPVSLPTPLSKLNAGEASEVANELPQADPIGCPHGFSYAARRVAIQASGFRFIRAPIFR